MKKNYFFLLFLSSLLYNLTSCGGGSAGTGVGLPGGSTAKFAGVIVSPDSKAIESAEVKLLNTDETTITNEAGAFELSSDFPGTEATFEISLSNGKTGNVVLKDIDTTNETIDFSVVTNTNTGFSSILNLTLRAKVIGQCQAAFLNSKTIKQTSSIPDGYSCRVEVEIKENGIPQNNQEFVLETRGCSKEDNWKLINTGKTGSSGPGIGEISFDYHSNQETCVYRLRGPIADNQNITLFTQINTLEKITFDKQQQ